MINCLMILDKEWCKPFDENRKGLNLGEGAAFLVIEGEDALRKRNGKALAEVIGYGFSSNGQIKNRIKPNRF